MEDSNEELKMDLAGFVGDFNRHRFDKSIKKRVGLSDKEFIAMITGNDKLKEISFSIR